MGGLEDDWLVSFWGPFSTSMIMGGRVIEITKSLPCLETTFIFSSPFHHLTILRSLHDKFHRCGTCFIPPSPQKASIRHPEKSIGLPEKLGMDFQESGNQHLPTAQKAVEVRVFCSPSQPATWIYRHSTQFDHSFQKKILKEKNLHRNFPVYKNSYTSHEKYHGNQPSIFPWEISSTWLQKKNFIHPSSHRDT